MIVPGYLLVATWMKEYRYFSASRPGFEIVTFPSFGQTSRILDRCTSSEWNCENALHSDIVAPGCRDCASPGKEDNSSSERQRGEALVLPLFGDECE